MWPNNAVYYNAELIRIKYVTLSSLFLKRQISDKTIISHATQKMKFLQL